MLQNLRQIKIRIKSVESTKRIMRAMEMVSAAKLGRVKSAFHSARIYYGSFEQMVKNLVADIEEPAHPLLQNRPHVRSIALCVIASDTGLCGVYNTNILRTADSFLRNHNQYSIKLITVGKEAFNHLKGSGLPITPYIGLHGRYSRETADEITRALVDAYTNGETDEVYIAYTRFSPLLRHEPVVEKFLNIECGGASTKNHIFEPAADELLDNMLPVYITNKMRVILLDAFTAEHSARMLAMKTANDNAADLIDKLNLIRNKARQFAITKEVLEIAASAEALKG